MLDYDSEVEKEKDRYRVALDVYTPAMRSITLN